MCSVCHRIQKTEDPAEDEKFAAPKKPKKQQASATERPSISIPQIPKDTDDDAKTVVFYDPKDPSRVLCQICYGLQETRYQPKE
jgi:hypothetical protein